jgi:hypothetical protein
VNASILFYAAILGSIAGIEGVSYLWTHPAQPPHLEVVMAGLPSSLGALAAADGKLVPLPEVYEQAAPMLRCTDGEVFFRETDGGISLHLAFLEWKGTDTGSVLEAFRHMPELCLGSVGMKLLSTEQLVPYTVGEQTIWFDHTVFRDPAHNGGGIVHSFRGIWVAGMNGADSPIELAGNSMERLRDIRLKSAAQRFRPPYACVIQGAVRGALDDDRAWQAFEATMLSGMRFK